jgi:hypothetical protein
MDPNTTLAELIDLAAEAWTDGGLSPDNGERAGELIDSLADWNHRGGFPPADLAAVAEHIADGIADAPEGLEYRLRLSPDGLAVATGCADYDLDHRGYIGCGIASADDDSRAIVAGLVDALVEAVDSMIS